MKHTEIMINITHLTLRKNLGILGMSLPFILVIGNNFDIQPSISHFYYTRMSVFFTGILFAFGLFLISYRGYKKENKELSDNWLSNFAGVLAILTALIPTACIDNGCTGAFSHNNKILDALHLIFAASFFIIMGWMAIFRFTKSDTKINKSEDEIKLKGKRNLLYKVCGIGVWISLSLLAVDMLFKFNLTKADIFIGETAALVFFGTAWLVKSKALKNVGL
jgi:hypothetical protein